MEKILLIIIAIVIAVLFDWYVAKEFAAIAVAKGFTDKKYFWWCFICTGLGYLMVVALPDHGGEKAVVITDELPDL